VRLGTAFGAAAAGGAAYAFSFEPYGLWPLTWFALVPLLTAQAYLRRDFVFAAGLLFGIVHAALSFSWMFGIFGLLTVLLFSVYATYFALAFLFVRASTEAWGDRALLWSAPIAWVAIEWLRSEAWWLKFSWFTAGSSLAGNERLIQTASIVGAYGLSALIVLVNASIALAIIDRRCRIAPVAAVGLALAAWIGGKPSPLPKPAGTVDVAMIEGEGILLDEFARRVDEAMRRAPKTTLVVLPEYATASRLFDDDQEMMLMRDAAKRHRVTLVFGGTERTGRGDGWHNMLFVIGPDGAIIHRQAKSVPLPFFRDGLPLRPAPLRGASSAQAGRVRR
jgi:apolipoprotein N-acyltransferase